MHTAHPPTHPNAPNLSEKKKWDVLHIPPLLHKTPNRMLNLVRPNILQTQWHSHRRSRGSAECWASLEDRRTVARLTMLYKINSDELPITIPAKFIPVTRNQRPVTKSQRPNQYINFPAKTEAYKNSFFPRTVRQWNQLPANIITDSTSAKSFNTRVWSYMQSDHSAQLYTCRSERRSASTTN